MTRRTADQGNDRASGQTGRRTARVFASETKHRTLAIEPKKRAAPSAEDPRSPLLKMNSHPAPCAKIPNPSAGITRRPSARDAILQLTSELAVCQCLLRRLSPIGPAILSITKKSGAENAVCQVPGRARAAAATPKPATSNLLLTGKFAIAAAISTRTHRVAGMLAASPSP